MELVSTMPKPEGFFDPKAPAGSRSDAARGSRGGANAAAVTPTPAAAGTTAAGTRRPAPAATPPERPQTGNRPPARHRRSPRGGGSNFANSDLAFRSADMFLGNFNGFNTYDIETPKKPRLLASVVCPGGQGDVSVHGNLLFMSVEQTRGRVDCGTQGVTETVEHGALPRHPHLRHQRHQQAEADRRHPDLPRLAHAHAGDRPERQGEHLHLRLRHRAGPPGRRAGRLLEQRRRTRIRTRRSSAST